MNTCYEVPTKPMQLFHVKKFIPFSFWFLHGFCLPACLYFRNINHIYESQHVFVWRHSNGNYRIKVDIFLIAGSVIVFFLNGYLLGKHLYSGQHIKRVGSHAFSLTYSKRWRDQIFLNFQKSKPDYVRMLSALHLRWSIPIFIFVLSE